MSRKLLRHRVVLESPDPSDDRRRLLSLSARGRTSWPAWSRSGKPSSRRRPISRPDHPFSQHLTAIDRALEAAASPPGSAPARGTRTPSRSCRSSAAMPPISSGSTSNGCRGTFRVEPIDEEVLSRPARDTARGGAILLARYRGAIVGTCALLSAGGRRFELSKMAVTPDTRDSASAASSSRR